MKIALINCRGHLPVAVFNHLKAQNHEVHIISFQEVKAEMDADLYASLGQIGKIFRYLKKHKINNMVLAGAMTRPQLLKLRFDWVGFKLILQVMRFLKKGDDTLLRFICQYIENHAVKIWSIAELCPQLLMPIGCLTSHTITPEVLASIDLGKKVLNHMAEFDIGQSIAVSDQVIVAIETLEGTDAMIDKVATIEPHRMNSLSRPVFIKMRKKNQSNLVDLPTIGIKTIDNLAKANFSVAAFEAKGCLIIDIDHVIERAKKHKIMLVGFYND
ncbi:MAG: DUF1009 family protein [Alphaproteobacteria bacterium]|jgi:DUF1009 family protein